MTVLGAAVPEAGRVAPIIREIALACHAELNGDHESVQRLLDIPSLAPFANYQQVSASAVLWCRLRAILDLKISINHHYKQHIHCKIRKLDLYRFPMRNSILIAIFACIASSAFAQSEDRKGEKTNFKELSEGNLLLERLAKQTATSAKLVATQCALAAAPACAGAVAAIEPKPEPEMDKRSADGLWGDYVGGIYGTGIAFATMFGVFATLRTTRKIDYKARTYQVFSEMLRTHEDIVSSIQLDGAHGREAIGEILSEYAFVYRVTLAISSSAGWSLHDRLNIAFTFTYYGPALHTIRVLKDYDPNQLRLINNAIAAKARLNRAAKKGRQFKGHQGRLSHYFRNLYAAYSFIDSSELSIEDKKGLAKVLRAKLSNYEQALLTINILSHLGEAWKKKGLVDRYMPIKNVPEHFFSIDQAFKIKNQFPNVEFEWE